ncbi:MAG: glycosyltransferase [Bauldia sp.]
MNPARAGLQATHVVAGLAEAHGGPSYSVPRLVAALRRAGLDAELLSVAGGSPPPDLPAGTRFFPPSFAGVPVLDRLRVSAELRRELLRPRGANSLIHGHGMWLKPNIDVATAARRRGVPLVVSPRGMLAAEALAFSRLRKAIVRRFGQQRALDSVACFHATSAAELDDIRSFGLFAPIAVIPNGIDVPAAEPGGGDDRNTVLSLGRLHPKKGLDGLIEAWAAVEPQRPSWRLRIVGPDENGHAAELQKLAARLGVTRVSIEDAVYGAAKAAVFRGAGVFVLPSRNENFGLTAAEALAAGVPVIAARRTPWSGLADTRAGWWVEGTPAALGEALLDATGRPAGERRAMGERGRAWMVRDFGWDRVAAEMAAVYLWLVAGGPRPASVEAA